ncbi:MAG: iron-sulfur cluster insertion protein ErpA [Gammaproteobacteria bacterium]
MSKVQPQSPTTGSIAFTASAAAQVRKLIDRDPDGPDKLRIYVTGGGCSGFQYGFKLDEEAPGDSSIETDGVVLVVDPLSIQYLKGAEVDYVTNLMGAQFTVRNPNAQTTCGCGSSFSV